MNSENPFKVGDILLGTWGYEACIATFAKVIAVGNKTIKIRECGVTRKHTSSCGMDWISTPEVDNLHGPVLTKKVKNARVKWSSYCSLYKWDGKPVECYNYH